MDPLFVLIHSPLVGPLTWSLVEDELRERAVEALTPVLADAGSGSIPYWQQQAESVARHLDQAGVESPVVLVAHSGAGPRLPAITRAIGQPVAACIFVDAGLPPADGDSQLADMDKHEPEIAAQLRAQLEDGGTFPNWDEDDLRGLIPDSSLRQGILTELQPRGLDYFTEPLPVTDGWPDVPCAYLLFSPPYHPATDRAREAGWPWREVPGGHFHMLVDPAAVADAIIELTNICLIDSDAAW